jgi:endonuclease/exonuclease/phosphatase (EEP) superfamily protein YafD
MEGLNAAAATLEDSPDMGTRFMSGRRIDYVFVAGADVDNAIVYDGCADNGVDDPPVGAFMTFSGAPLACGRAEAASDHRPLVVDLTLE